MSTFYNNGNYDLYLGTGAGKKLLQDIQDAKESIKIISPYLSPYLTKELINLHNKNVNIQLITSDDIKDKENIYDLILQNKYINEESVKNRVLLNKKKFIFKFLSIVTIILSATIYFFNQNIFLSIFFTFSSFCSFYFFKKIELNIKNIKIFNYNYSQLFPFKVFKSQYTDKENGILIHAKLYIIDDKIAYLGSLNFTYSGVKGNYESRLKTVDKNVINKLIEEFCSLMNSNHPQKDIQLWGKELYPEPLNESF